jgi:hypothetical protein
VSIFVDSSHLALLVAMAGIATMRLEQIKERLREAGHLPRFVAPAGTKPPPELKSSPPPPRRQVGRKIVEGERGGA